MKKIALILASVAFCIFSNSLKASTFDSLVIKNVQKICDTSGNLGNVLSSGDNFGIRMAYIGDLDSDGVPDIAVGCESDATLGGAFYILFMNRNGTVKSTHKISQGIAGLDTTFPSGYKFGYAIADLGDIDGDGIQDLAVSAIGANGYSGAIYILHMKRNGDVKSFSMMDRNTPGLPPLADNDLLGYAITSIGDVNGDGNNDIAVGAPGSDGTGGLYIFFLNANGSLKSYQMIDDTAGNFSGILSSGDFFGDGLAPLGDLDSDGVPDILTGGQGTGYNTGAAYILYLTKTGTVKKYVRIDNSHSILAGNISSGSLFGTDVGVIPNINNSGLPGLVIGAEVDNNTGAIYILYPSSNGTINNYQKINNNTTGIKGQLALGGEFGPGIAFLPSLNSTYPVNIAIGDFAFNSNEGAVYLLSLQPSIAPPPPSPSLLGHVTQSTGKALKSTEIYLLNYNWGDSTVSAVDSTITDSTGYYKFNLTATDTVVYLYADPDSSAYPTQMPTYDSAATVFQFSDPITTTKGADTVNFSTVAGTNPGGTGFIGGKVTVCWCKKAGPGTPVVGLKIVLMNSAGKPVAYTYTDNSGNFSFKNLAIGNYAVYADRPMVDNTKAPEIDLTAGKNIQQNLDFSLTPTQLELLLPTAIQNVANDKNDITVYPNPFEGIAHLNYHLATDENVDIRLFDVSGKEVSVIATGIQNSGDYSYTIDKNSNITTGIYFIRYVIGNDAATFKIVNVE